MTVKVQSSICAAGTDKAMGIPFPTANWAESPATSSTYSGEDDELGGVQVISAVSPQAFGETRSRATGRAQTTSPRATSTTANPAIIVVRFGERPAAFPDTPVDRASTHSLSLTGIPPRDDAALFALAPTHRLWMSGSEPASSQDGDGDGDIEGVPGGP